ncbi:hypothetical protein P153DRAFT_289190 [Dothidotthia symphoricarpi CBS 119687]|uniref:Uncharacterized protein n=1 Tax=Dothidotthia symphoricarpi CBS 119687 TaxID=1392245 RepID=A0A6A6AF57_9PLEO|nr:uncharacterized protein P153DRAFT_289190 [Dothidotthia symphoricarpi CBS 119687]KAF2130440.1 hypothetical protein P153DRAFT_289190 [Dothidotthia symphoricarpi CBS 119687]
MPLALLGSYLRGQTPSPSPVDQTASIVDSAANTLGTTTPQKHVMTAASHIPSRPASSSSSAVTDDKPKKRAPRAKTCYILAQPPPTVNPYSRLHIRPKVVLQLHQVLASERPKPVYEVIPFSLLEARSTRRLAPAFNTRERLGHNDLLIVKAEEYGSKSEKTRSDDERWGSRDVIGVICPGKGEKGAPGKTEICMNDGKSRWEVTSLPNGGYEFNTTNEHGLALKARWVLKPAPSRRWSGASAASQPSAGLEDNKKFTFSTISSDSRRHPIIATMTRTRLDVLDSYAIPLTTSPSTPSLISSAQEPVLTPASIDMDSFIDNATDRPPTTTDDALRQFIVASGIWVIAKTWSPDYSAVLPPTSTPYTSTSRPSCNRTVSMSTLVTSRPPSPSSTCDEKRRSFPKLLKTGTRRLSFDAPDSPIGSMRKRYALAFDNNTLPETEEEKQSKRSIELLRIKELALPSMLERPSVEISALETKPIPTPAATPLPPPSPTPPVSDPSRARKTQSAYNPITTAGMWDSGITEGPGLKKRPTSMFVINERKRKQEKKRGRGKEMEIVVKEKTESDYGSKAKNDWMRFKKSVKGLFRKSTC